MTEPVIEDLQKEIKDQKKRIKELEDAIANEKKINAFMDQYFDALYKELNTISAQKDKEIEHIKYIDTVMEKVYDNIHKALDSTVKEKESELESAKDEIDHYKNYLNKEINKKTKELSYENTKLKQLAMTDELTNLSNRRGFIFLGKSKLIKAMKKKQKISIFFIDLDNFKNINDKYGHKEGDYLLKQVAWVLCKSLRGDDLISRFGGDEFVLFIQTDNHNAVRNRINENIQDFNNTSGKPYSMSLSIGVESLIPDSKTKLAPILKKADKNMYKEKKQKKKITE